MSSPNIAPSRPLPTRKRRSRTLSTNSLIKTTLFNNNPLPLIVEPALPDVDLVAWADKNRTWINTQLYKHGGVLFRGFGIDSAEKFAHFVPAVSSGALQYTERSSPRSQVKGNVYTSTSHPSDQSIYLHNEQSYNLNFPLKIIFCCLVAPQTGGQTPIADTRKVYQHITPSVRERFLEQGYMYVRNFGSGFGLSWQEAFQTDERTAVEAYCDDNDIAYEWLDNGGLRTRQVRRVAAAHPISGDMSWCNHATFFHVSTLEPKVRATIQRMFATDELPNNTYYGDGSPIEDSVLEMMRTAYAQEQVMFNWQVGDVIVLDNFLTAHARMPFTGPRQIVTSMTDATSWASLK